MSDLLGCCLDELFLEDFAEVGVRYFTSIVPQRRLDLVDERRGADVEHPSNVVQVCGSYFPGVRVTLKHFAIDELLDPGACEHHLHAVVAFL